MFFYGKIIYADHSATTYVKDEVLKEMLPYFTLNYGNPSSAYSIGRVSKEAVEKARIKVAKAIGQKVMKYILLLVEAKVII